LRQSRPVCRLIPNARSHAFSDMTLCRAPCHPQCWCHSARAFAVLGDRRQSFWDTCIRGQWAAATWKNFFCALGSFQLKVNESRVSSPQTDGSTGYLAQVDISSGACTQITSIQFSNLAIGVAIDPTGAYALVVRLPPGGATASELEPFSPTRPCQAYHGNNSLVRVNLASPYTPTVIVFRAASTIRGA